MQQCHGNLCVDNKSEWVSGTQIPEEKQVVEEEGRGEGGENQKTSFQIPVPFQLTVNFASFISQIKK